MPGRPSQDPPGGPPSPPGETPVPPLPFPESLCHACAAPPRYVRSDRGSVFVFCPVYRKYPPQPVRECAGFAPREGPASE